MPPFSVNKSAGVNEAASSFSLLTELRRHYQNHLTVLKADFRERETQFKKMQLENGYRETPHSILITTKSTFPRSIQSLGEIELDVRGHQSFSMQLSSFYQNYAWF